MKYVRTKTKERKHIRVCALQWKTTGVAGLNSELVSMYKEGKNRGHDWEVFETWPWKQKAVIDYGERQLIRGGDVYITVNGKISHHPDHVAESVKFINENYDYVYLSGFVPHPNKAYGDEPHFYDFLNRIELPMVGRICDGYVDSYKEWFEMGLELTPQLSLVTIAHSYRSTVEEYGIEGAHIPFYPEAVTETRSEDPSLIWLSQWKNIKGIKQFVKAIPDMSPTIDIDMYSNGIEYYQMRSKEVWKQAMGTDNFAPEFSGNGRANFHGYTDLSNIPKLLQSSWAMADFQGMGRARYEVYNQGSINTTGIEALWYGALPIVAENSTIPDNLCVKVSADDIADAINYALEENPTFVRSTDRQAQAQDYVLKNFHASTVYDTLVNFS